MQFTRNTKKQEISKFDAPGLIWALGSVRVLHQRNFSPDMLVREFPPDASETGAKYSESTLLHAAQRLGFRVKRIALTAKDCASLPLPVLVQMHAPCPAMDAHEAVSDAVIDATPSIQLTQSTQSTQSTQLASSPLPMPMPSSCFIPAAPSRKP